MPSPLECSWYIEGLLALLALLLIFTVLNFIFVLSGKAEHPLYLRFDVLTTHFSRIFGALLLFTILWLLVAYVAKML